MKTLEERRDQTGLRWPIFLLQRINEEHPETWETDRVFLTAEEAEEHLASIHYRILRERWRIYAVPAAGELKNRLEAHP